MRPVQSTLLARPRTIIVVGQQRRYDDSKNENRNRPGRYRSCLRISQTQRVDFTSWHRNATGIARDWPIKRNAHQRVFRDADRMQDQGLGIPPDLDTLARVERGVRRQVVTPPTSAA